MIAEIIKDTQHRMDGAVAHTSEELAAIRTGRAHPAMFAKLMVDYYGAPTPLLQLATLQVPEARTALITPFDRGAMAGIERAIRDSSLGVNPANDGNLIRIVMPQLTEERRKEYIKVARAKTEEGRVAVRNIRRHSIEAVHKLVKAKEIGEDDARTAEKKLDSITKAHIETIDGLLTDKETELREI